MPRWADQRGLGRLPALDTKLAADLFGTGHLHPQAQFRTSPHLSAAPSLRIPAVRCRASTRCLGLTV